MTDTQKQLSCPACGKEMSKIFIKNKSINIDICDNGCGGIYFDNQEIQEFSEYDDDISEIQKALEGKQFSPANMSLTRICPNCKIPMVRTKANGIPIDTCYNCGGIFLDYGEFENVRTHFIKRHKKAK